MKYRFAVFAGVGCVLLLVCWIGVHLYLAQQIQQNLINGRSIGGVRISAGEVNFSHRLFWISGTAEGVEIDYRGNRTDLEQLGFSAVLGHLEVVASDFSQELLSAAEVRLSTRLSPFSLFSVAQTAELSVPEVQLHLGDGYKVVGSRAELEYRKDSGTLSLIRFSAESLLGKDINLKALEFTNTNPHGPDLAAAISLGEIRISQGSAWLEGKAVQLEYQLSHANTKGESRVNISIPLLYTPLSAPLHLDALRAAAESLEFRYGGKTIIANALKYDLEENRALTIDRLTLLEQVWKYKATDLQLASAGFGLERLVWRKLNGLWQLKPLISVEFAPLATLEQRAATEILQLQKLELLEQEAPILSMRGEIETTLERVDSLLSGSIRFDAIVNARPAAAKYLDNLPPEVLFEGRGVVKDFPFTPSSSLWDTLYQLLQRHTELSVNLEATAENLTTEARLTLKARAPSDLPPSKPWDALLLFMLKDLYRESMIELVLSVDGESRVVLGPALKDKLKERFGVLYPAFLSLQHLYGDTLSSVRILWNEDRLSVVSPKSEQ